MSDPRQEDRLREVTYRVQRSPLSHEEALRRINDQLSPCDDELPFAQAMRQKEEMAKAAAAFRARHKRKESDGE